MLWLNVGDSRVELKLSNLEESRLSKLAVMAHSSSFSFSTDIEQQEGTSRGPFQHELI